MYDAECWLAITQEANAQKELINVNEWLQILLKLLFYYSKIICYS